MHFFFQDIGGSPWGWQGRVSPGTQRAAQLWVWGCGRAMVKLRSRARVRPGGSAGVSHGPVVAGQTRLGVSPGVQAEPCTDSAAPKLPGEGELALAEACGCCLHTFL